MSGRRLISSLGRRKSALQSAALRKDAKNPSVNALKAIGSRVLEQPVQCSILEEIIDFRGWDRHFTDGQRNFYRFFSQHSSVSTEACLERTLLWNEPSSTLPLETSGRVPSQTPVDLEGILAASADSIRNTKDRERGLRSEKIEDSSGSEPAERRKSSRRKKTSENIASESLPSKEDDLSRKPCWPLHVKSEPATYGSHPSVLSSGGESTLENGIGQNGLTSEAVSDPIDVGVRRKVSTEKVCSPGVKVSETVGSDVLISHGVDSSVIQRCDSTLQPRDQNNSEGASESLSSETGHLFNAYEQPSMSLAASDDVDGKKSTQDVKGYSEWRRNAGHHEKNSASAPGKKELKVDLSDPGQIFQALLVSKQSGNMPKPDREALVEIFRHFHEDGWALDQASLCYVSSVIFPTAVSRFRKFFLTRCTPEIRVHLLELRPSAAGDQFLFPLFAEFCCREFPGEIARYKALVETADLTKPHTWFPFARVIKRKIIYHAGPTNSGKTYNALKRFKEASSGVYCSPLRLLAMEVFDSVNAEGVYCSLYTGQEKKEVPFSNHVACTIEMASTQRSWEVAVIDEVQMLNDEFRGWAWTRALLGLQADEIHVCGDPSALGLVRDMCAVTGDELEEFFYERFEPLSVDSQSLEGNYQNIQPGDCIVSFSRKEIFSIKRAVERATTNRCCVVYGALPPETRTHQAKLFNDPNSGYDVLVATDAVGMGLNLNIRRVIFYTLDKFNGEVLKKVPASQVKQIAGRAGRRGSLYQEGSATTFYARDAPYLVRSMEEPFSKSSSAGLFPMYEQMELFATQLPEATFSKLLDRFSETCRVDGFYFLCRNDNLKKVACIIDKVKGLTLEDRLNFIFAPVNTRDPKVMGSLLNFAIAYSKKLPVHLAMMAPTGSARSDIQLMDLEARHQVVSLYLWLSQHFPEEYFPQKEQAEQLAADIALLLGESLAQSNIRIVRRERPIGNQLKRRMLKTKRMPTELGLLRASADTNAAAVLEVLRASADTNSP